jgi:hypothetical protein
LEVCDQITCAVFIFQPLPEVVNVVGVEIQRACESRRRVAFMLVRTSQT